MVNEKALKRLEEIENLKEEERKRKTLLENKVCPDCGDNLRNEFIEDGYLNQYLGGARAENFKWIEVTVDRCDGCGNAYNVKVDGVHKDYHPY